MTNYIFDLDIIKKKPMKIVRIYYNKFIDYLSEFWIRKTPRIGQHVHFKHLKQERNEFGVTKEYKDWFSGHIEEIMSDGWIRVIFANHKAGSLWSGAYHKSELFLFKLK